MHVRELDEAPAGGQDAAVRRRRQERQEDDSRHEAARADAARGVAPGQRRAFRIRESEVPASLILSARGLRELMACLASCQLLGSIASAL